jgi:hypothetical protein
MILRINHEQFPNLNQNLQGKTNQGLIDLGFGE